MIPRDPAQPFHNARGALHWRHRARPPARCRAMVIQVLLIVLVIGALTPRQSLAAPDTMVDAYADVLPGQRDEISDDTAGELSSYAIDATLDPETNTIAGEARVTYQHNAAMETDDIYFRLYPNAAYYDAGSLTIKQLAVAGDPIVPDLQLEESALRVPLSAPITTGEAVEIELVFTTTVPVDTMGSYGIFNRDTVDGTWILADWHPVLAVFEADTGWQLDPVTAFGDPTYAASALYDVTIAAPSVLMIVASGTVVDEKPLGDLIERRYVAGPAREFTFVADDDYESVSTVVDGTTITAYVEPEAVTAGAATLDVAARALETLGERFGPYPFAELDLVQTRLSGALAVSWSGIIFLDGPLLVAGYAESDPAAFETVVAHEIAHLWWGASVGNNSNHHTFINEGLATVSSIVYLEATAGDEAAAAAMESWVGGPARALLRGGDAVVDLPIADGQDQNQRAAAYYAKSTLGFFAIRQAIGDEAFFAALRSFAETFAFGIAEPIDLLSAFETASGLQLDELWRHWFQAAEMTADEIETIIAG